MLLRFLGAIQFLTIIPIRGRTAPSGQSALFFPLVGALVGALAGLVFRYSPGPLGPVLALIFLAIIGGGLHEDGLADIFDALRSYRTREKMFAILKDSRIGAHGAMALIFATAVRWSALTGLLIDPVIAFAVAQSFSRAAVVALAWTSRPLAGGSGAYLNATMTSGIAIGAILQGLLAASLLGWKLAVLLTSGSILLLRFLYLWFHARLGGINGDCLGTTAVIIDCYALILFACHRCIS
ncbi:MAG TPA: adenosylcobinamide-GDP ribazoletransferase [Bryobacteraceae bacterium]|nr:adenosylcobinamide-GDP ribazoletransferase [Bryobacteraceae bacterium]